MGGFGPVARDMPSIGPTELLPAAILRADRRNSCPVVTSGLATVLSAGEGWSVPARHLSRSHDGIRTSPCHCDHRLEQRSAP
jgi:hypothetical protein